MRAALEQAWWSERPGPLAWLLLLPLRLPALAFAAVVALRGRLYDRGLLRAAHAAAPVISVGNLAVGGAGKTPVTLAIARRLAERGRTVAVLSRGYGATRSDPRVVCDGHAVLLDAAAGGDEPVLMARRLPGLRVLCGPRRAELAAQAVARLQADALLLDDGLQHRALARDLDVVVLDAANPLGNGWLLPAGPGREGRGALRRAGLVWLSRVDQAEPATLARWRALAREATGREAVESRHAPVDLLDGLLARSLGLEALRGRRVLLLSGLARPGAFRRTVEGLGATVVAERRHRDHHRFSAAELDEALAAASAAGAELVVTTEKDAVRLAPERAAEPRLAVVRIEAEVVAGEGALHEALDAALALGDGRRRKGTA
jgi:tetraacyldisaccharide 4'-kinase